MTVTDDFDGFVRANWSTLMSIGVAVSGSRAEAEDLVQTALINAYKRWPRIRPEQALAYLRRSIVNAQISRWRRHRGEFTVAEPPERHEPDRSSAVDDRLTLLSLVRTLPTKQRAVLVLRYLCDLPDDEIAQTLNCSTATVRSQASRALATLRERQSAEPAEPTALAGKDFR
jgi:RNA polymerase sigma-70 factor (sigma-E family)